MTTDDSVGKVGRRKVKKGDDYISCSEEYVRKLISLYNFYILVVGRTKSWPVDHESGERIAESSLQLSADHR